MAFRSKDAPTVVDEDDDDESPVRSRPANEASSADQTMSDGASKGEVHSSPPVVEEKPQSTDDRAIVRPGASATQGREVQNRYTLSHHIENGAHGQVWRASDRIAGHDVAFKWMHVDHDVNRARVRREITMLRMLRIPGVVRFMDEGVADGKPFIVMEYFPGSAFPGVAGIPAWETIADTTLALLETLSQLHAAGVVHRDLKPANVLVASNGRPMIVDFGVSQLRDPNLGRLATKGIVGTPPYLAPEQILRHEHEIDARTDLYAIGIMLYEALTGRVPHDASNNAALMFQRVEVPAVPLRDVAPHVPAHVAAAIDRLLARRPEDRFSSATDVIAHLRGESSHFALSAELRSLAETHPFVTERALMRLFEGPDRLLHLREDAARLLFGQTKGNIEQVELELERWVRLGLATRKRPVFVVDRVSLDWLAAGFTGTPDERRVHALFAEGNVEEGARCTIELALQYAMGGQLSAATRVLSDGLRLVREYNAVSEEVAILTMLSKVALAEGTPRAYDQALYELARAKTANRAIGQLRELMQASLEASGARKAQAREAVEALGALSDPVLERARHRIRIASVAARASAVQIAEMVRDIEAWWRNSRDPQAELAFVEGQARQRYHEGRFEEASELYLLGAARETWATARIDMLLRSASASMEAFQHEAAAKTADEARRLAAQSRHAYWEGRAEWVLRSVQYRTGNTSGADMEFVRAVELVGANDLEALVCFNEAAAAMRGQEYDCARTLADRAATIWRNMERPPAEAFARALAIACGASTDSSEVDKLVAIATSCAVRGIGIQTLGLLGRVFPTRRSSWQNDIDELVGDIPREHWHKRMDVLSVEEALETVR